MRLTIKTLVLAAIVPVTQGQVFDLEILGGAGDANQVVSPTPTVGNFVEDAPGITYDTASMELTVSIRYDSLGSGATQAHVHLGAVGFNGPSVFTLTSAPPFNGTKTSGITPPGANKFVLTPAQEADLFAGLYYVNIHTVSYPAGEVRGQILVPEPHEYALLATLGLLGFAGIRRRLST